MLAIIFIIILISICFLYNKYIYNPPPKSNINIKILKKYIHTNLINSNSVCLSSKYNLASINNNYKIYLTIPNSHYISNKKNLWLTLKGKYGEELASAITPLTFILPNEYDKYKEYHTKHKNIKFIFKENKQRQEGIFVASNIQDKNFLKKYNFIVAQKFISDTLKYKNLKITVRAYLMIEYIQYNGHCHLNYYVYKDGLVYYGKHYIASYYDSKYIYNTSPITISKLEKTLNINIISSLNGKIQFLFNAFKDHPKLSENIPKDKDYKFYELFGVDFHITSDLKDVYILEVNHIPDMKHHNIEDKNLRENLMKYYASIINKNIN